MPGQRRFSMVRDFHLADVLTLGNGACGTASIFCALSYAQHGCPLHVYCVGVLLFLALAFDALDGRVARWRRYSSPLGRELDSLADVISFGVAPACLGFALGLQGFWDQFVLVYFVCCGISRLARYNITADALADGGEKVPYYEGTPIPTSTLIVWALVALTWLGRVGPALPFGSRMVGPALLHPLVLVFAVSGSLMISKTLRIPKP